MKRVFYPVVQKHRNKTNGRHVKIGGHDKVKRREGQGILDRWCHFFNKLNSKIHSKNRGDRNITEGLKEKILARNIQG